MIGLGILTFIGVAAAAIALSSNGDAGGPEESMRGYVEAVRNQDCEAELGFHSEQTLEDHSLERWTAACELTWRESSDEEVASVRNTTITEVRTLDEGIDEDDGTPWAFVRVISTNQQGQDHSFTERLIRENGRWVLALVSPTGDDVVGWVNEETGELQPGA